jgi:predicted TIM-barrel fold metal-dependent hydrolase
MLNAASNEPILEPELPIVDPHHHFWLMPEAAIDATEARGTVTARGLAAVFRLRPRYLFDELLADVTSGHKVLATVYNDARAMYRSGGPPEMKSVGEVEFVNGMAAMAASGVFGNVRICAGIVGGADLRMGACVERVLEAHIQAGGDRYRGVRVSGIYDEDYSLFGAERVPHLYADASFRTGFSCLERLKLSFDALLLEPQLPDLIDLARAFPDTQIILNHLGAPVGAGRYTGKRDERFPVWRASIQRLATCANVTVKLGGFGNPFGGFDFLFSQPPATSEQLASQWRPYIETCIEAFGAPRCMFESNFPVDIAAGAYPVIWNAFKRIAAGASRAEKAALFSGTAMRVYRLDES